jgi:hypothetical protein
MHMYRSISIRLTINWIGLMNNLPFVKFMDNFLTKPRLASTNRIEQDMSGNYLSRSKSRWLR